MTDHGNLYGAYDFFKQATAAGVKPIIGLKAYLTPGTHRSDRTRVRWADGGENDVSGGGTYTHMTMLAADAAAAGRRAPTPTSTTTCARSTPDITAKDEVKPVVLALPLSGARPRWWIASRRFWPATRAPRRCTCAW
nr:PHP domain-containing protein [Micromonospora sp. NBRC 107566]